MDGSLLDAVPCTAVGKVEKRVEGNTFTDIVDTVDGTGYGTGDRSHG